MVEIVCYAKADTPRALIALVAPLGFLVAMILAGIEKGYSLTDYPVLLSSGQLAWFPQVVGWMAFLAWIVRYYPPAWQALWDGPCLVSGVGNDLYLPSHRSISLASVRAVTVQRGLFRKVAYFEQDQGRVALNLIFVQESSDDLLRCIASR